MADQSWGYRDHLASNIGLSGFKQLLGPEANCIRRCAWLLFIMLAMGWMLWNICGQVTFYLGHPTTVTTELVYPSSISRPDITICNQNLFRATQVFNMSAESRKSPTLYEALDHYFRLLEKGRGGNSDQAEIAAFAMKYGHLLEFPDVEKFYLQMAHQKEVFIKKCLWRGKQCGPGDFRSVMTDLGLCFRFSPRDQEPGTAANITSPGPSGGLEVELLLEQYDYMRGLREGVGVVVMVTEAGETAAMASQMGVGVSAGTRSALALRQQTVKELPEPHGTCSSRPLAEFPPDTPYTPLKCQLDCMTSHVRRKCGCVDVHMPRSDASVPFCSLLEKLHCVEPAKEEFYGSGGVAGCQCPERCQAVRFQTSLSSSRLSPLSLLSMALEAPPSLASAVSRSLAVQDWAVLNKINPRSTDDVADMADTFSVVDVTLGNLVELTSVLEANVNDLLRAADASGLHDNLTSLTASLKKPLQNGLSMKYDEAMINLIQSLATRATLSRSALEKHAVVGREKMWVETSLAVDAVNGDPSTAKKKTTETLGLLRNNMDAMSETHSDLANFTHVLVTELRRAGAVPSKQLDDVTESMATVDTRIQELTRQERALNFLWNEVCMLTAQAAHFLDHKNVTISPAFFGDNVVRLEVYLEEMSVQEIRKEAAYSVEALVCDVGGTIGLCLGGSVLTIVEIFDLLLFYRFSGKGRKKKDGLPNAIKLPGGEGVWGGSELAIYPPPGDYVKTKL